jgi:hypothetical protein
VLAAIWLPFSLTAQTEIAGTVTAVDGRAVTIQIPGDLLPREGDAVRLRFRDPIEGAGLVFLEGTWAVSAVRRDEVEATPQGETAQPQNGLVAVIASESPQSKADVQAPAAPPAPAARPNPAAPPPVEEAPVTAVVRQADDSDVQRIDRRRWVSVTAGASAVGFQSPAFQTPNSGPYDVASSVRPRITASFGLFLLPNLAVSGYLGSVKVDADVEDSIKPSAQEIYKALGATLYVGTSGNVPGDITPFLQGGYAWYDIKYNGGNDADVTGTGFFLGAGAVLTIKREFGLYIAGQFFNSSFDEDFPVFDRQPFEINAGAQITLG